MAIDLISFVMAKRSAGFLNTLLGSSWWFREAKATILGGEPVVGVKVIDVTRGRLALPEKVNGVKVVIR